MQRVGFKPYSREWWHFEFADEPFPQEAFDFPVAARVSSQAGKPPKAPSFRSQWASFRSAVLKREAAAVANMTRFPFPRASEEMDQAAFVADFDNIFNGYLTGCIALGVPELNPKSAKDSYGVTCGHNKNDSVLIFQTINGIWRLTDIVTHSE